MSDGTLWSIDLDAPLLIDTDADPGLWGYLHLKIDKKTFKEWLELHLTGLAAVHDIELTRKLRRFHKRFYEQTIVTLRDKLQADEAFVYHPVPLGYVPLVMYATRFHCRPLTRPPAREPPSSQCRTRTSPSGSSEPAVCRSPPRTLARTGSGSPAPTLRTAPS